MSTVQVSNITDGTNSVETVYVARGSAKAWVNFNGTGTIAARDSLNLSSLTDNGTGDYTVNFSSAFDAADYLNTFGGMQDNTNPNVAYHVGLQTANGAVVSKLVGSVQIYVKTQAGSTADGVDINTLIHGDLA